MTGARPKATGTPPPSATYSAASSAACITAWPPASTTTRTPPSPPPPRNFPKQLDNLTASDVCTRTTADRGELTTERSSATATSTAPPRQSRCCNSAHCRPAPAASRPPPTTSRQPNWPATNSAAIPPVTPTATTASPARPSRARSAAPATGIDDTRPRPPRDPVSARAPACLLHPADHHRRTRRRGQDPAEARLPLAGLAALLHTAHRSRTIVLHHQRPRHHQRRPRLDAA